MTSEGLHPQRVLLGGGIGAGKSTVGGFFADFGYTRTDADVLAAAALAPGTKGALAVGVLWPHVVDHGVIDRAALAAIVFSDADSLRSLEAITHPIVTNEIERIAATTRGSLVVEVPLPNLKLSGQWTRIAVVAPEESRVQRAIARGGDPNDVRARVSSQVADEAWAAWADTTIDNSGSEHDARAAVKTLVAGSWS
jgi:dephospho-CoA kinase